MAAENGTPGKKTADEAMGTWIAIGAGLGTAFGAVYGNVGVGVALGVALGAVIGAIEQSRLPRRDTGSKP